MKNVIQTVANETLVSDLYASDAADWVLLAEYPSSNSDQTRFRNVDRFIIHDPFPPPRPELLKCLGPHHLMFGWGGQLSVTSQTAPPDALIEHWCHALGSAANVQWVDFDEFGPRQKFVTLFPHQSLTPEQQLDPVTNYFLHSKEVIGQIDCPQADIYPEVQFPCIAKLSHGYAGLSNYILRNQQEAGHIRRMIDSRWPGAKLVYNSIVEKICEDFGIQFYLKRDGTVIWLGFTEQNFNEDGRWCGGKFSTSRQAEFQGRFDDIVMATANYLHRNGYFGVVGVDILIDDQDRCFLVDVNPRLTGITPFLIASRMFSSESKFSDGQYRASCCYKGSLDQLIASAEQINDAKVCVLSAFDDRKSGTTICHLSVTTNSSAGCEQIFDRLLGPTT